MRFDVTAFLDDQSIPYSVKGKNISHNWVGVESCPFCGDRRYHMGINRLTGGFSCWVCGTKGWIYEFIGAYYGIPQSEVKKIGRTYLTNELSPTQARRKLSKITRSLSFPSTFSPALPETWIQYLENRNFDISIAARYSLHSCSAADQEWKYRLIIPFYIDSLLVSWAGRDITGQMDAKYKNCKNEIALIDTRQTIYNIDAMGRKSILVEGFADVWRMGGATGAVVGLNVTTAQLLMIKKRGVEECTILFDSEPKAQKRAKEVAKKLEFIGVSCRVIDIGNGKDPGDLTDEEAFLLRKDIFKIKA